MADFNPPDERRGAVGTSRGGPSVQPRHSCSGNPGDRQCNGAIAERDVFRRPSARPRQAPKQAYAAIDLGTNNCRLLIARPAGENFVVIDAFSRVVRLGEGWRRRAPERRGDGSCARRAQVCADKLKRRNVHLARSVATEACRRATNGAAFIERVRRETGIGLDIISAQEEARLAVLGCHILLEDGIGPAVIFDIGGGSTELVLIEPGAPVPRILDWQSVPWGVVSLTEVGAAGPRHEGNDARGSRATPDARSSVSESFAAFAERIAAHATPDLRLLGTSGTVTTLASVHLELPQYDRRAVDGLIVPAAAMRDIATRLSACRRRSAASCRASATSAPTSSSPAARSSRRSSTSGPPTASASPTAASAKASCAA